MFSRPAEKIGNPRADGVQRGCLPTYVTSDVVILCKRALMIRNSYEIRLTLFMAKERGLQFVLSVPQQANVSRDVQELVAQHGGKISASALPDYSVYFGGSLPNGVEKDGWVLGNSDSFQQLTTALRSVWLREHLTIGKVIAGSEFKKAIEELEGEKLELQNIDHEDFRAALLDLLRNAERDKGSVFIQ